MKSSKSIKGGTTFNRKTIYITLSSVASVTLGLLVADQAHAAAAKISSCPSVSTAPGTYTATQDINCDGNQNGQIGIIIGCCAVANTVTANTANQNGFWGGREGCNHRSAP